MLLLISKVVKILSQYTISLNAVINISSNKVNTFFDEKIESGRSVLFNYEYETDNEFKKLFEELFITKYIDCDICFNAVDRWLKRLELEIKTTAPLCYKAYSTLRDLRADDLKAVSMLKDVTLTDIESTSNGKNDSKSKGSNYPNDVLTSDFNNIKYASTGTATQSSSKADTKSQQRTEHTTENIGDIIERVSKYNSLISNIISKYVDSLAFLFMGVY